MKILFAVAAAAAVTLAAAPAVARPHSDRAGCMNWRNGHCVGERRAMYRVGYRFGPRYGYTPYGQLPRTYLSQYRLRPGYRYVYRDNVVYVVNPRTYAVERVINAMTR
jgi:hypothetical protein